MGRKIIIGLLIVGVGWVAFKLFYDPSTVYFYSPDGEKCITFLDHEDISLLYLVPGKWEGSEPPDSNYVILKMSQDAHLSVDWTSEKYRFTYFIDPIENKLDTSKVDFSKTFKDDEIKENADGSYYDPPYPKLEVYSLYEIIRGTYKKIRKAGGVGEFYKESD